MNYLNPWGHHNKGQDTGANKSGGFGGMKLKGNFWGDMDGDGKETSWDDVLGDGILMDAMEAQQRARRGEPTEPDDEFLVGRRYVRTGTSGDAGTHAGAVIVVVVVALGLVLCLLSSLGTW